MSFHFRQMTQTQAEEIAYNWHYSGIYSFYDIMADEDDLKEFLDAEQRGCTHYVVLQNEELVGFYTFHMTSADTVDIGLGMRPDLTGRGIGNDFIQAGLDYAREKYAAQKFTLSVASFNKRAIRVYEQAGFKIVDTFEQETNGGRHEFYKMCFDSILS